MERLDRAMRQLPDREDRGSEAEAGRMNAERRNQNEMGAKCELGFPGV